MAQRVGRAGIPVAMAVAALQAPLAAGCAVAEPEPPAGRFSAAGGCAECHPRYVAEWERSMHSYAATSPVTLRLNELAQLQTGGVVGQDCFTCHAPAALIMEETADPATPRFSEAGQQGVGCDLCHSLAEAPEPAARDYASLLGPRSTMYGRLADPEPTGAHASQTRSFFGASTMCSGCHQFSTAPGRELENTFGEWEQTSLAISGVQCQDCHMPVYSGRAATDGPQRAELHGHSFVGVDYPLAPRPGTDVARIKADIERLLGTATRVVVRDVPSVVTAGEVLRFDAEVTNKRGGHSIPSGVSFWRQMWLAVSLTDAAGATIYRSGHLDEQGDLAPASEDPDLAFFGATLLDAAGNPTWFPWSAAGLDDSLLLAFGASRTAAWSVTIPPDAPGPLSLVVSLRFRPLAPAMLREIGLADLLPIEVFDMWTGSWTLAVAP